MISQTVKKTALLAAAVLTVLSLAACKNSGEQTVSNGSSEASEVSVVSVSESQPSEKEKQESGASLAEQLLGFWTSEDENGYINVKIIENGDAIVSSNALTHSVLGKWSLSGKKLTLTFEGSTTVMEYKDGVFVCGDGKTTFKKGTTSPAKWSGQTSEEESSSVSEKELVGTWSCTYGGETVDMRLMENGTSMMTYSSRTGETYGKWAFLDNKLTLFVNGETVEMTYQGEKLISDSDEQLVFTKKGSSQTSEQSRSGYQTSDIYGKWAYGNGELVVFMTFTDDGMVQITGSEIEGTVVGLWELNDNKVTVSVKGVPKVYTYNGAFLISVEDENELFYKT